MSESEPNELEQAPPINEVERAIDTLSYTLNQGYLIVERLMSLRETDINELNSALERVNKLHDELITMINDAKLEAGTDAVIAATKNKTEFDLRVNEWRIKRDQQPGPSTLTVPPTTKVLTKTETASVHSASSLSAKSSSFKSSRSSRSSKSSIISVKRLNAQLKLKSAQLEADHANQRIKEQNDTLALEQMQTQMQLEIQRKMHEHKMSLKQSETRRKLEHAKTEFDVLNEFDSMSVKSLPGFFSKVSKVDSIGKLMKSSSIPDGEVSIGQPVTSIVSTSVSQITRTLSAKQSPTVSIGRYSAHQRPGQVEGLSLSQTSIPTVSMGHYQQVQRPGQVERPLVPKPVPKVNISTSSISATPMESRDPFLLLQQSFLPGNPFPQWPSRSANLTAHPPGISTQISSFNIGPTPVSSNSISSIYSVSFFPELTSISDVHGTRSSHISYSAQSSISTFMPSSVYTNCQQSQTSRQPECTYSNDYASSQPKSVLPLAQYSAYAPGFHDLTYDNMFLPRPELPKYSGDPLEFKAFISNFETHIEPRVKDQKMLFCLLTQHCVDPVRERIQHLAMKGEQCYQLAKLRLFQEYGSPWIMSDTCEQKLKGFTSIKSGDAKRIKLFAELLEKSLDIMNDINNFGSLNSLDTLTNLTSKLPFDLRRRLVTKSVDIERKTGSIAKFADFVSFVQNESAIANSLFGKRSLSIQSSITSSKPKPKVKASSFHATATSTKSNLNKTDIKSSKNLCWYCNESSHWLLKCKSFQSMPVKERLSFVKQRKLCHKCLSSKHRTPECKRSKTCVVNGCTESYHHTLLHRPTNVSEGKPIIKDTETTMSEVVSEVPVTCGLAKSNTFKHFMNSRVYLCVVPVKVSYAGKVVTTYAFLDQGFTHSFFGKSLIKELGIIGTHENLNLKTITGTTTNLESTVYRAI